MKYLKLFESEQPYFSIDRSDIPKDLEQINFNEITKIFEFLFENGFSFGYSKYLSSNSISVKDIINKSSSVAVIYKIPDEWFIVYYQEYEVYYKCDEVQGLIENLKEYL